LRYQQALDQLIQLLKVKPIFILPHKEPVMNIQHQLL